MSQSLAQSWKFGKSASLESVQSWLAGILHAPDTDEGRLHVAYGVLSLMAMVDGKPYGTPLADLAWPGADHNLPTTASDLPAWITA